MTKGLSLKHVQTKHKIENAQLQTNEENRNNLDKYYNYKKLKKIRSRKYPHSC